MIKSIAQAAIFLLTMTLILGVLYPLSVTGLSQLLWPKERMGSLLMRNNEVVGSSLIGQKFTALFYFWPRPSASDYNTMPASGSNLGPTSAKLKELIEERRKYLAAIHNTPLDEVPELLLSASGSGLDPIISTQAAYYQLSRVARARGLNQASIDKLHEIMEELQKRAFIPFNEEAGINVLMLNLSLDETFGKMQ